MNRLKKPPGSVNCTSRCTTPRSSIAALKSMVAITPPVGRAFVSPAESRAPAPPAADAGRLRLVACAPPVVTAPVAAVSEEPEDVSLPAVATPDCCAAPVVRLGWADWAVVPGGPACPPGADPLEAVPPPVLAWVPLPAVEPAAPDTAPVFCPPPVTPPPTLPAAPDAAVPRAALGGIVATASAAWVAVACAAVVVAVVLTVGVRLAPTVIWPLLTTVPSIGFAVPAESSPLTTTSPSVSAVWPLASALRDIVATVPLPLAPAVSATPLLRFDDAIRTLPTDTLPLELSGVHCGSTVVSRPFAVAQFLKNVPSSTDSTSTMLLSKVRLNCAPRLTRSTFTTTSTVNASPTCTFFVDGEMLRLVLEEETGPGVGVFVWRSAAGRVVPVITV